MKKNVLIAIILLQCSIVSHAQQFSKGLEHVCGYDQVMKRFQLADPHFKEYTEKIYGQQKHKAARTTGTVYKIPVVFHIVYNTAVQNLPDSVIQNQLAILNKAYRKQNSDIVNLRPVFTSLAADTEIEFVLATRNPEGTPTTGITRTFTNHPYFGYDAGSGPELDSLERVKSTIQGGIDPWPTDRYLNIWIGDFRPNDMDPDAGLQGYATPPNNPYPPNNWTPIPPYIDGVAMHFQAIGNNNAAAFMPRFISGGIYTVHEVGHYLGLRHIWGGDAEPCSSEPGADDGISDTPMQATSSEINISDDGTHLCPPDNQNTCGAGTAGDLPDLWENYMDYGSDSCRIMFTQGQAALMRYVLDNQRSAMLGPLPVTLTSFTGVRDENTALLNWATTDEVNSDRFEIERSVNGKNWNKIGVVGSYGESRVLRNYSFVDKEPIPGGSSHNENLYRLRIVDRDQTFAYSRICSVKFNRLNADAIVFPNPVSDKLLIRDFGQVTKVIISDLNGQTVYQSNSGIVNKINVGNLPVGTYLVKIIRLNGIGSEHKIVVAR